MADFTFTADSDFSKVFADLAKVSQGAKQAGDGLGKGLSDGLATANANITALSAQIKTLIGTRAKLQVDSTEYKATQKQIDELQLRLQKVRGDKLRLQVDATAVGAAAAEFGKLGPAAKQAGTEVEKGLGASTTDQFRLLDGVVQGVAFSLSNAVVDGAGRALQAVQDLIGNFAKLDTTIRQAAAADGGAGAYDKLAATIDKVGIDAAGTQQQVADLTVELVRGGLSADQVSESLGGIVRGAEATATAYDRMGQIVSATLTAFGLSASETTRVVDALVQGANSSATDVSGLGEAFKISAPAAKLLGVSVEGLTTAVGLFTNAGITASEAGTALRNGLSQLGSAAPQTGAGMSKLTGQAKAAADAMKELGLDIYNTNGTLKPMEQVLLQLKGAFDKLGPAAQIQLASKLFGGTDDGTKWLAVLSQSEEKIKLMAKAMDNAKGATDRNRDAMQGFQLTVQQLTGTIDSLGNNVGRIAAAALLPLVNAANAAVGAIAALPAPVKDAVIALGLLVGGVTAATTAFVVFKRVLELEAAKAATAEILSLATGIGQTLVGGTKAAVAVIPGLLTQLKLIGEINVVEAIKGIATALNNGLKAAVVATGEAFVKFLLYLQSASFASFISTIGSMVKAVLPLTIALAAVAAAVVVWRQTLSDSNAIQEDFKSAQEKASESSKKLEKALKELGVQTKDAGQQAQESVGFWKALWNSLAEPMGMRQAAIEVQQLQEKFDNTEQSATAFYNSIKNGTTITAGQVAQSKLYSEALTAEADILTTVAAQMRKRADIAEQEGKLDLARQLREQADGLERQANGARTLNTELQNKVQIQGEAAGMSATDLAMTEQQIKLDKQRIDTERELNKLVAEAPVRALDRQLELGKSLLELTKSIGAVEQSRYAVTKSALEFELNKAKERGASEQEINGIKRQIDKLDQDALSARYKALQQEQALQRAMLTLSQEKAKIEADLAIQEQKIKIMDAQVELAKAEAAYKKSGTVDDQYAVAAAQATVKLQEQILGTLGEKRSILDQTQPLERAIAAAQAEAAVNGEKAKAAAMGFQLNLDGSLTPLKGITGAMDNVATLTTKSSEEASQFSQAAAAAGLEVGKAKDGTLVLGQSWADVNAGVEEVNRSIDGTAKGAGDAKAGAEGIKGALAGTKGNAEAVAGSFVSTGKSAPAAAQGARDFAAYLSGAKGYGVDISKLNLDTQFKSVASSTGQAAGSAKEFYNWLKQAAALPGSRWTGGPVEAGGEYKINELGQEAFLSAGRLSLIDAAPNSIWRAPSEGVVIPAGITARLKAQTAAPAGGTGGVGAADLAIEVGKLREEVGNLARRDWSVHVQQRTGPTGSQILRTLLS